MGTSCFQKKKKKTRMEILFIFLESVPHKYHGRTSGVTCVYPCEKNNNIIGALWMRTGGVPYAYRYPVPILCLKWSTRTSMSRARLTHLMSLAWWVSPFYNSNVNGLTILFQLRQTKMNQGLYQIMKQL
jgi:hypothetical protein